jgi:hypothetical protein
MDWKWQQIRLTKYIFIKNKGAERPETNHDVHHFSHIVRTSKWYLKTFLCIIFVLTFARLMIDNMDKRKREWVGGSIAF